MYDPKSPLLKHAAALEPGQKNQFAEERLRNAVIWCEIEPGETVAEANLVERFGLGRAATRAALTRLASDGWVASIARQGWHVLPVTGALIGQVLEARRLTEPAIADANLTGPELDRLRELGAVIGSLSDQTEFEALNARRQYLAEMDALLLNRINPLIRDFLQNLWNHSDRITCFLEKGGNTRFHRADATALIDACLAGDRSGIRAARLSLIDTFERFVIGHLLTNTVPLASAKGDVASVAQTKSGEPFDFSGSYPQTNGKETPFTEE